jgi:hypothetical protein
VFIVSGYEAIIHLREGVKMEIPLRPSTYAIAGIMYSFYESIMVRVYSCVSSIGHAFIIKSIQ